MIILSQNYRKFKNILYRIFLSFSLFSITFAVSTNNLKLSAFIIWCNIRKLREIRSDKKNTKKILVFPKSGGYEDLVESFKNQKNHNIHFFLLPRKFLKIIYTKINRGKDTFKNPNLKSRDYFTKPKNSNEKYKKKMYIKFLTSSFKLLDKYLKLDGFISFNIFYHPEKYFEEVCRNLNKKLIILHKESVFTPYDEINIVNIYNKHNDKSLAHKISVYSESQKKILIKSKIATTNQIQVNGCPRSDFIFRLRKIKPQNNVVVFYLIESNRVTNRFFNLNNSWKKLYIQTLSYLIEFAKNNSEIKIILKGKTGVHTKQFFAKYSLPKNCTFIEGGAGEQFLKNASVVVAFNSTVVFEAILSNRNLIIPNFNNEYKKKRKFLHAIKNKKYFSNSKKNFLEKLNIYLNLNYQNKELSNIDKKTIKHYLGNTDGKSGKKVKQFLNKILN